MHPCTIITTDANEAVKPIHNRMPAVIEPEYCDLWLGPANRDTDSLQGLLVIDTSDLESYPVSTAVNSLKNNGRDLIEKLGDW